MHNRRVRQVNLKDIDFSKTSKPVLNLLDHKKTQDIEDVTPKS
jgi:hypothetical protein